MTQDLVGVGGALLNSETDRIKSAFRLCQEEGEILGKAMVFEGGNDIQPLWWSGGLSVA